jgi:uncharacterized protein
MAKNFAEIGFSPASKALQEKMGSRASYARVEANTFYDGLTEHERRFIAECDSFYMATVGDNGFPYIQHRGGPKGFLTVLDKNRLGFIDFSGNKQYISLGNLATNQNVALFLMDYARKTRLKLYAKAEIVELADNPKLFDALDLSNYNARPERLFVLHIEAFDWNCPQHITPRFTTEEIEKALQPQKMYIKNLENEVETLKNKLKQAGLA